MTAYGPTGEVIDQYMGQVGRTASAVRGLFVPEPEPGRNFAVKSLELFSKGRRTDTIRMGDDLSLRINLNLGEELRDCRIEIGLGIESRTGQRIVSLGTRWSGMRLEPCNDEFTVQCNLGCFPLNQGQYTIRLNLTDEADQLYEGHEGLGLIHVLPTDIYGSGMIPKGNKGFFYWKPAWDQMRLAEISPRK